MTEVSSLSEIANHPDAQKNTNNNSNNTNGGCVYDKYGRTPDKSKICAIGIKSASADTQDGVVKCVFENKCAHCGQPALMWGWKWEGDQEKIQKFNGTDGTAEGHIYCVQSEGGCDADFSIEGNEHINGSDAKLTIVSGPTPSSEEEAQQLSSGQLPCDGSSGVVSSSSIGGGGVSIPDKTFYGLIKQIIGAIDGLFIIANNMAYLLSFKDFYEYRDLYDTYIPTIERKDVIYNSIVRNWTTDGYYNSVEVTYADGIIKYQNDALVQQYGENTFYYNFPDDDEETAKAKADALLGAHIRDYSTEIELSVFYNENITAGSWVKLHKSLSQLSGKTHREILLENQKKPISSKHNGIDITNLIEKTIVQDNITKTIQSITDKKGNKFDIEIDKSEYELFFVQSFTCRWDKDNALIMDLVLKYGPDTPEDPVNATIGTGQAVSSGGGQSSGGMYGSDCFAAASSSVQGFTENPPSDLLQGRANQNAQYAKDVAGKTPEEAFNFMNSKFPYCYYSDNCATYNCVSEWYDSNPPGANCADSACLIVSVMNSIGVKACVVHVPGHYFNQIELNGKWVTCDMVDSEHNKDNSNTAGFPTNFAGGRVSCPCASNGGRTS